MAVSDLPYELRPFGALCKQTDIRSESVKAGGKREPAVIGVGTVLQIIVKAGVGMEISVNNDSQKAANSCHCYHVVNKSQSNNPMHQMQKVMAFLIIVVFQHFLLLHDIVVTFCTQ